MLAQWSMCGFKLGETLIFKRHAKRFADEQNKEVDSSQKVRNGSSFPRKFSGKGGREMS